MRYKLFCIFILLNLVAKSVPWQYFTSISDLTLIGSDKEPVRMHSQYTYGNCKRRDLKLFAHVHKDHIEILGKVIVRGWLKIIRMPTCIILRATSYEEDLFRSTTYNFQICVPRITYCHSKHRYKYFYYEWYLPLDYIGGMNWDLYFYGPPNLVWQ
ncbi:uncharacterized protein LOC119829335 [Zerene cesonia]|uniref:uncharacterized protein LOC119829335 n=1 Tax=Zerene cesonia TaxID=33412 RepID=UPI0018E54546|nr:uncharacterized protein LOC119829335 [Zerene cesonia]